MNLAAWLSLLGICLLAGGAWQVACGTGRRAIGLGGGVALLGAALSWWNLPAVLGGPASPWPAAADFWQRHAAACQVAVGSLLLAVGLWRMLPRGYESGRRRGAALAVAGIVVLGMQIPRLAGVLECSVFSILAGTTLLSALCTVTFRSPVYCAVWFGLTLLGVCGLLLYQGAEFLAVATLVVYAGAILVTFLFVLMLAQPRGQTTHDRISWEAFLAACTGAAMIGILSWSIGQALPAAESVPVAQAAQAGDILAAEHVARLGRSLFGRHLLGLELAGTLLLVALVGTVGMIAQDEPQRFAPAQPGKREPNRA